MYRQVGPLTLDEAGLATRGVLVRHLVLPLDIADSRAVIDTVAETAPGCTIHVMDQYRPSYHACRFPELTELPKPDEVAALRRHAEQRGLILVH
jgi:putative pyruvate formate lyase activating enzyme